MQLLYLEHGTACPAIAGYLDLLEPVDDAAASNDGYWFEGAVAAQRHVRLVGWAFPLEPADGSAPTRAIRFRSMERRTAAAPVVLDPVLREDVATAYQNADLAWCGWDQIVPWDHGGGGVLEMLLLDNNDDDAWTPFMILPSPPPSPSQEPPPPPPQQHQEPQEEKEEQTMPALSRGSLFPSVVVVDEVYADPLAVRAFALAQPFHAHPASHKGERTDQSFLFPGLQELIERRLGGVIRAADWTRAPNGCFQWCKAGDPLVYHTDAQEWAGVLFLTPDAPVQCGTTLFKSRATQRRKADVDPGAVFAGGFLDATRFEPVDVIGNVFNRLVLFDARLIHAASQYFGTDAATGRLFQMFFFNLE